jgi:hypothetical protein
MALPVFALLAMVTVADAARINSAMFDQLSLSLGGGNCAPVMAKWICQAGVVQENMECAKELCHSKKMAKYNDNGPHPFRDACCRVAAEAVPPLTATSMAKPLAVETIKAVAPAEAIEAVKANEKPTAETSAPETMPAPEPVFQAATIKPNLQKKLEKVFVATARSPKLSWGMSCIALCEAENVDESDDSGCQAIQSVEDCKAAMEASEYKKFQSPTTPAGISLFSKFPAGCLVPTERSGVLKDYVLWNPPSGAHPHVTVGNVCGRYEWA